MKIKFYVFSIAFIFMVSVNMQAEYEITVTVNKPGNLYKELQSYNYQSADKLTILGVIDAFDLMFLRPSDMPKLSFLDLSAVNIASYTGEWGPAGRVMYTYPANSIPGQSFMNSMLITIILPTSVTHIESGAFRYCTNLTTITIPSSVTSIEANAFSECYNLETINYNAIKCTSSFFDDLQFRNFNKFKTVNFGLNVQIIPPYLLTGCTGLTSINLPNSLTTIGINAFSGCTGLTSVNLSNSLNSIGNNAFSGCTGLTSINLPNSLTSIGGNAFSGCTGLTSINLPNSLTSIGNNAFSGCTGLTSITLPNAATSIGDYAFSNCKGVETITISESIKTLPAYLFQSCTRVREINSKATFPPSIDATTFSNLSRNIPLYTPLGSRVDYAFDPYWSEFFNIYTKDYVNNVVFLNKQIVSIISVGSGYILKQPIKSGESVSFLILPDNNFKIQSLTVNGKNMLDSLDANGYLNLKSIIENKTIVITPKNINSGVLVSEANDSNIRSWCANGNLFVESNSEMNQVELLDLNGRIIETKQTNAFAYVLNQPNQAINVIRVRLLNGMQKSIKVISN